MVIDQKSVSMGRPSTGPSRLFSTAATAESTCQVTDLLKRRRRVHDDHPGIWVGPLRGDLRFASVESVNRRIEEDHEARSRVKGAHRPAIEHRYLVGVGPGTKGARRFSIRDPLPFFYSLGLGLGVAIRERARRVPIELKKGRARRQSS